jgi:hypothetical protein
MAKAKVTFGAQIYNVVWTLIPTTRKYLIILLIFALKLIKMAKAYSSYKLEDVQNLGIELTTEKHFDESLPKIEPTDWLKSTLEKNRRFPVVTEKAKSELIITPILTELHEMNLEYFTCFSGYSFDIDANSGLKGRCDFLLSRKPHAIVIEIPVFAILEAKKDDIEAAYPQCIAQMYAARVFNKRHNIEYPVIYGAVTTGFNWKFIKLIDNTAWIDTELYYLNDLPKLLGILQTIINIYK